MTILLFDMGLPMIIPSMALMLAALIPIVFLECWIVSRKLAMPVKTVLFPVAIANAASTLLGIPATWSLLTAIEFIAGNLFGKLFDVGAFSSVGGQSFLSALFSVTLFAPWVPPTGNKNESLIILGAMLFLLIPYGFGSWGIEYLVIRSMTKLGPTTGLNDALGKANLISYLLLALTVTVFFAVSSYRA